MLYFNGIHEYDHYDDAGVAAGHPIYPGISFEFFSEIFLLPPKKSRKRLKQRAGYRLKLNQD